MICPSCKSENDDTAEACFTCGRALAALTQGSVIAARYEILSPLGKGGMGMVYKAHDRMLDETVAIKVLRAEFANTADMAKRFRHEIKLARKVSHRNVCRIHEYGEDQGIRYISMEYVEGTDLKQLARDRGGCLGADEALRRRHPERGRAAGDPRRRHRPPRPEDREHHARRPRPRPPDGLRHREDRGRRPQHRGRAHRRPGRSWARPST